MAYSSNEGQLGFTVLRIFGSLLFVAGGSYAQIQSGGIYTLVNQRSGLALDSTGGSTASGTPLQQWVCNGQQTQNWILTSVGGGAYTVVNQLTGLGAAVYNADPTGGTPIDGFTPDGQQQSNWYFNSIGGNVYNLVNQRTSTGMTVSNASLANGSAIQGWSPDGQQQQNWQVVPGGTCENKGFNVLIDTNQMTQDEVNNISSLQQLGADGVWAVLDNTSCSSTCNWTTALEVLNGSALTLTEEYFNSYTNHSLVQAFSSAAIAGSMVYEESGAPQDTILLPDQIDSARSSIGNGIIVNSRSYADQRASYVREALGDLNTLGVSFESNANYAQVSSQNFIQGIQDVLSSGRKVFMLLPPQEMSNTVDYLADITGGVGNYLSQSVQLNNPNLYIVLAVYQRYSSPGMTGSGTGFFVADSGASTNTVVAARNWLLSYRLSNFGR